MYASRPRSVNPFTPEHGFGAAVGEGHDHESADLHFADRAANGFDSADRLDARALPPSRVPQLQKLLQGAYAFVDKNLFHL